MSEELSRRNQLSDGAFESGFEEVTAAFEDLAVAWGYAFYRDGVGEVDEFADTFYGGGAVPGGDAGEGEVPGAEAGDVG